MFGQIIKKIMSGGNWDYIQYRFTDIAEDIDKLVEKNGKAKTKEEIKNDSWYGDDWYDKYPEDRCHYKYPDDVIEEFKKASAIVKLAQIYVQRIDWLVSGDDGEESFITRLKKYIDEAKRIK